MLCTLALHTVVAKDLSHVNEMVERLLVAVLHHELKASLLVVARKIVGVIHVELLEGKGLGARASTDAAHAQSLELPSYQFSRGLQKLFQWHRPQLLWRSVPPQALCCDRILVRNNNFLLFG